MDDRKNPNSLFSIPTTDTPKGQPTTEKLKILDPAIFLFSAEKNEDFLSALFKELDAGTSPQFLFEQLKSIRNRMGETALHLVLSKNSSSISKWNFAVLVDRFKNGPSLVDWLNAFTTLTDLNNNTPLHHIAKDPDLLERFQPIFEQAVSPNYLYFAFTKLSNTKKLTPLARAIATDKCDLSRIFANATSDDIFHTMTELKGTMYDSLLAEMVHQERNKSFLQFIRLLINAPRQSDESLLTKLTSLSINGTKSILAVTYCLPDSEHIELTQILQLMLKNMDAATVWSHFTRPESIGRNRNKVSPIYWVYHEAKHSLSPQSLLSFSILLNAIAGRLPAAALISTYTRVELKDEGSMIETAIKNGFKFDEMLKSLQDANMTNDECLHLFSLKASNNMSMFTLLLTASLREEMLPTVLNLFDSLHADRQAVMKLVLTCVDEMNASNPDKDRMKQLQALDFHFNKKSGRTMDDITNWLDEERRAFNPGRTPR